MIKDFDAARAEQDRVAGEKLQFRMRGQTFTCVAIISPAALIDLTRSQEGDETSKFLGLHRFLRAVIVDADLDAFDLMLASKDDPPTMTELTDLVVWMAESFAARPTTPSTSSAASPSNDGRISSTGSETSTSLPAAADV